MDRIWPSLGSVVAEQVWERSVVGMAFVDAEGRWLRANATYCQMLRYTESELRARRFQDMTAARDIKADEEMAARVAAGTLEQYVMFKTYIAKDDVAVKAIITVRGVFDQETGAFLYFFVQCVRDTGNVPKAPPLTAIIPPRDHKRWSVGDLVAWLWENRKKVLSWAGGVAVAFYAIYEFVGRLLQHAGK